MDPMIGLIGTAVTVVGVLASAWLTKRGSDRKLRADASQQMIDQLQEEVVGLRQRVGQLERNQRIQGDYIGQLRRHIADGNPPPAPSWPDGLIT